MKTITGTVMGIELGVSIPKKDGGNYEGWRLTYRDDTGKISEIAKPIGGLRYQPALRTALQGLANGDRFAADMEKNDRGYLEVVSVRKGDEMPVQTTPAPVRVGSAVEGKFKSDKSSNWETTEERARRQVLIVRQSSIAQAVELVGQKNAKLDQLFELASKIEDWVMREAPVAEAPEVE